MKGTIEVFTFRPWNKPFKQEKLLRIDLHFAVFDDYSSFISVTNGIMSAGAFNSEHAKYGVKTTWDREPSQVYYADTLPDELFDLLNDYTVDVTADALHHAARIPNWKILLPKYKSAMLQLITEHMYREIRIGKGSDSHTPHRPKTTFITSFKTYFKCKMPFWKRLRG